MSRPFKLVKYYNTNDVLRILKISRTYLEVHIGRKDSKAVLMNHNEPNRTGNDPRKWIASKFDEWKINTWDVRSNIK